MALDETAELRTLTGPQAREALALVTDLPGVPAGLTVRGLLRRVKAGRDLLKARVARAAYLAQLAELTAAQTAAREAAEAQAEASIAAEAQARADALALDSVDYGTD